MFEVSQNSELISTPNATELISALALYGKSFQLKVEVAA